MTIAIRVRIHNLLLETVLWGDTELMRGAEGTLGKRDFMTSVSPESSAICEISLSNRDLCRNGEANIRR